MSKTYDLIKRFIDDEQGTALVEYTMLLGTFVVAVLVVITTLGNWLTSQWTTVCGLVKGGC